MSKQWERLFTKTANGGMNFWEIWTEHNVVHTKWGGVDGQVLTDSYMAEGKNLGRANETSPAEQAVLEAQSKFEKKLRVKYFTSQTAAKTELNLKPMLAATLDKKRIAKMKFPVHVQPKLNGVRCIAYLVDGDVRLMSRGGKDYEVPHVQEALKKSLKPGQYLDGELYSHGMSLQLIRHHIDQGSETIGLTLYDMFRTDAAESWATRHTNLMDWYQRHETQGLGLILTHAAENFGHIEALHDRFVEQGFEGAIIRLLDGPYRIAARSQHLLKYKKFQDAEFRVTNYTVGKDGVIVFTCLQEEGLPFEVRPTGTEDERAAMLKNVASYMGKLLTVKFQDRSDSNIPLFPVGIGFRSEEDL